MYSMLFPEGLDILGGIMLLLIFVHSEVLWGYTVVPLDANSEEQEQKVLLHFLDYEDLICNPANQGCLSPWLTQGRC